MCKNSIDIKNFSKDLIYYKKRIFNEIDETEDFDINEKDLQSEKIEFQSNNDNFSEPRSQEESCDEDYRKKKNLVIISGLINFLYLS